MTRRFLMSLLLAAGFLPAGASLVQGADCPTPPNQLTARVEASVEFDAASAACTVTPIPLRTTPRAHRRSKN
jgi:hypothetical protein